MICCRVTLHLRIAVVLLFVLTSTLSTAFLPSNQPTKLFFQKVNSLARFRPIERYMTTDEIMIEEYDNEDDNELEDYYRSLTPLEKKQMTKDFFARVLDYNEEMRPEFVHIILFNVGTNREGAHTIEFPKNSGNNVILGFEDESECSRFGELLKEQEFFDPVVSLRLITRCC